jgi:hypothetical protein
MITGKEAFFKEWKLDTPQSSMLWEVMTGIINLGGTFEKADSGMEFWLPYTHSTTPWEKITRDRDPYFTAICTAAKCKVFNEDDTTSPLTAYLNYDIVEFDPTAHNDQFLEITTFDKKINGFALRSNFSYEADITLILRKDKNGNWKITSFAGFD